MEKELTVRLTKEQQRIVWASLSTTRLEISSRNIKLDRDKGNEKWTEKEIEYYDNNNNAIREIDTLLEMFKVGM